jgi:hypothetical protein
MPNDAPDFTRAGCTLQFFAAKATPGKSILQTISVAGNNGTAIVFSSVGTYRLATWGVSIAKTTVLYTLVPGYAMLRVGMVILDSIRWPTEMASGRVQGYVVNTNANIVFKVTGTTSVIMFVTYALL